MSSHVGVGSAQLDDDAANSRARVSEARSLPKEDLKSQKCLFTAGVADDPSGVRELISRKGASEIHELMWNQTSKTQVC